MAQDRRTSTHTDPTWVIFTRSQRPAGSNDERWVAVDLAQQVLSLRRRPDGVRNAGFTGRPPFFTPKAKPGSDWLPDRPPRKAAATKRGRPLLSVRRAVDHGPTRGCRSARRLLARPWRVPAATAVNPVPRMQRLFDWTMPSAALPRHRATSTPAETIPALRLHAYRIVGLSWNFLLRGNTL